VFPSPLKGVTGARCLPSANLGNDDDENGNLEETMDEVSERRGGEWILRCTLC
jgi:hypothetical protein